MVELWVMYGITWALAALLGYCYWRTRDKWFLILAWMVAALGVAFTVSLSRLLATA